MAYLIYTGGMVNVEALIALDVLAVKPKRPGVTRGKGISARAHQGVE